MALDARFRGQDEEKTIALLGRGSNDPSARGTSPRLPRWMVNERLWRLDWLEVPQNVAVEKTLAAALPFHRTHQTAAMLNMGEQPAVRCGQRNTIVAV